MRDIYLPMDVTIHHSPDGQPTVLAADPQGLAFGQGYLSALHRFWSMEQQRRVASARMSELAGAATLAVDQWICKLGLIEAVDACYDRVKEDREYYTILASYTEGVNYALKHNKRCLGIEFKLTNCKPEPWSIKDTVRIMTLVSWSLAGNWEEQLVRLNTMARLGPEQAAMLESDSWARLKHGNYSDQCLAQGIRGAFEKTAGFLMEYQEIRKRAGLLPRRSGSNAWIVAGEHTENGKPILAGDPHMPLGLPGLFYEVRLQSHNGVMSFLGAAIPGIPGVIIGRNKKLAWSITVSGAITAELKIEPAGAAKTQKSYTIKVKGQPHRTLQQVDWTANGPVLPFQQSNLDLSLAWTGHDGVDAGTLSGIWSLMFAQSGQDLQKATQKWGGPVLNLLWAEVEQVKGAYGWQVIGTIPLRDSVEEGLLPTLAEDNGPWMKGFIPAQKLPSEHSPDRGYLVSANHRMTPADYPYVISHEYMSSYRAERIENLIKQCLATKKYTIDDARHIQIDQTSEAALDLRYVIVRALQVQSSPKPTAIQLEGVHLLERWDGSLKANSAAAAIVKLTEDHLYQLIAEQLFPSTPTHQSAWLGTGSTPLNAGLMAHWRMRELLLALIIARPEEFGVIPPDQWDVLLQKAFAAAIEELSQRYDSIPGLWRWGQLHKLEINHPLVQVPVYEKLSLTLRCLKKVFRLSRGDFELGGDEHTPWQASSYPVPVEHKYHKKRLWATAYQPAYRMIALDGGRLFSCLPGGLSGHPLHKWSSNQLTNYLRGRLFESSLKIRSTK